MIQILSGDCRETLATLPADSVDSCVTDPPYGLVQNKKGGSGVASVNLDSPYGRARIGTGNGQGGFMGMAWDHGVPGVEFWQEVYRVLKPGAWLLAFGGTRTHHRLVCAIEDAGFEIRDEIQWLYGSGFPKSLDVSKAIDRAAGAEREVVGTKIGLPGYSLAPNNKARMTFGGFENADTECAITAPATDAAIKWQGWGTALKPAQEPICVARKPLIGTVAENVARFGTGALNIDGCRVATDENLNGGAYATVGGRTLSHSLRQGGGMNVAGKTTGVAFKQPEGRWPANVIHDGSDEVLALFPHTSSGTGAVKKSTGKGYQANAFAKESRAVGTPNVEYGDAGSAARFFYCAKASRSERGEGNTHPTVKPIALMRYLCRLVTPPGGTVLDPFAGSGTTGLAAKEEGFGAVLCEMTPSYVEIMRKRLDPPVYDF